MPLSALTFSAAIHFAMKQSTPCSAVLCRSPSSWSAIFYWSALVPKARKSPKKHPLYFPPCPLRSPSPPISSPNITHSGSIVYFMHHKSRKQDLPPAHNGLDTLTFCPYEGVLIGNRVVGTIVLSPTDGASQEAVAGSARRVVVARMQAPRDAVVQYCQVSRLLASGFWSRGECSVGRTVRECTSGSCTMHWVYDGRPRSTCHR